MNKKQLSALLILIVPNVIKEIMESEKLSENEATESFYGSAVYAALENEETKLWHLSPMALHELYRQEMETGRIEWPEEA